MTPLVIPLNRRKLALSAAGAAAFVALGIGLLVSAQSSPHTDLLIIETLSVVCVAFFGSIGTHIVYKLLDRSPGLVIDSEGLVDNSSGIAAGRIPWSDIRDVKVTEVTRQRFMTIDVLDPEKYIRRASGLKRWVVAANSRFYGGPIHITANMLDMDLDELVKTVRDAHASHAGA